MADDRRSIELVALRGMPEIAMGADLAAELAAALQRLNWSPRDGDILVVTQKIVSKAERQFRRLRDVVPSAHAKEIAVRSGKDPRLVQIVLDEAAAVVRVAPNVVIARHRSGVVIANSGVDQSNRGRDADDDLVLTLPKDADRSASRLRAELANRIGDSPAIVISDSAGRPWRQGVVGIALGCSGLPALWDRRGEIDRDGRALEVTQVAVADLVASMALLAMGEGKEGIPAVLIRNLALPDLDVPAAAIIRPIDEDLFR